MIDSVQRIEENVGMRIVVLGADGYLGWPTAMRFAARGAEVLAVDNYLRRTLCDETGSQPLFSTPRLPERAAVFEQESGRHIEVEIGDCTDREFVEEVFARWNPDTVVHYAEQPSAPYSMLGYQEAKRTLDNNVSATFNVIWATINRAPDCHIIKLGTMGEYGTPNIDIEEGWIEIEHKGRTDKFLYPRQAGSLYHTTKILDTDLLWFYVRTMGITVTDLMQGPVYGLVTGETGSDVRLMPNFNYDDMFGTVVNRFLVQAVAGVPLTVYGEGGQTRGYLNLRDTLQCVELAADKPPGRGELRILNQFTERFSVNDLAERVKRVGCQMGLNVDIKPIPNPRKEAEDHYYNPTHSGLLELGLQPHYLSDERTVEMLETVIRYKDEIDRAIIMPRVAWNE